MVFHVLAVGRIRDEPYRELCNRYLERARRYARLDIREVLTKGRSREPDVQRRGEGDALLDALPYGAHLVAVTRGGRSADSRTFADRIQHWREGARDVAFLIGGAHGFDPRVTERAAETLSLSPFTMPHELARVVLLEQLYRGYTILEGEPYHKGV